LEQVVALIELISLIRFELPAVWRIAGGGLM